MSCALCVCARARERRVASEGSYLLGACADADGCTVDSPKRTLGNGENADGAPGSLRDGVRDILAAADDPLQRLPDALYSSSRAAAGSWATDTADAPSPFRLENFDLLQRATTREAMLSALAELQGDGGSGSGGGAGAEGEGGPEGEGGGAQAASAAWLREHVETWVPRFESPRRTHLAGLFLLELLTASPAPRQLEEGGLGLTDPERVAEAVLAQRQTIASEWADALEDVPATLQALLAERLQADLDSDDSEAAGEEPQ